MTLPGTPTSNNGASNTGPLLDFSGTGTAGGVTQVLLAEAADRKYIFFQNISAGTMWVDFGVAAVQDKPSIKVAAGGILVFEGSYIPGDAMNMIPTTTGDKFVLKAA